MDSLVLKLAPQCQKGENLRYYTFAHDEINLSRHDSHTHSIFLTGDLLGFVSLRRLLVRSVKARPICLILPSLGDAHISLDHDSPRLSIRGSKKFTSRFELAYSV
jgi:hypothetical protein